MCYLFLIIDLFSDVLRIQITNNQRRKLGKLMGSDVARMYSTVQGRCRLT